MWSCWSQICPPAAACTSLCEYLTLRLVKEVSPSTPPALLWSHSGSLPDTTRLINTLMTHINPRTLELIRAEWRLFLLSLNSALTCQPLRPQRCREWYSRSSQVGSDWLRSCFQMHPITAADHTSACLHHHRPGVSVKVWRCEYDLWLTLMLTRGDCLGCKNLTRASLLPQTCEIPVRSPLRSPATWLSVSYLGSRSSSWLLQQIFLTFQLV